MPPITSARSFAPLFVFLVPLASWAQDPIHRHYTVADGLPSNTVYGVMQDHRGFIWFGTDAGASRFDGRHFVNYGQREGLPDEEVLQCYEDRNHRLWLLLLNGKLAYIRNDTLYHPGNDPALRAVNGRSGWARACEDRDGNVWFGGVWGELIMLDKTGKFHPIDLSATGVIGGNVTPMLDPAGDLFIQINTDGFVVEHGVLQRTFSFGLPGPSPTYSRTPDGRLWAASIEGLIEVRRTPGPVAVHASECGPWDRIRSLAMPGNGVLIYGRWDRGAVIVDPRRGILRSILMQETINAVMTGDEGNCWLTTAGGGVYGFALDQIDSRIITEVDGVPLGPVSCLHADGNARLWIGTEKGLVLRLDGAHIEQYDMRIGIARVQKVRALCDDGHFLYATTDMTTVRIPLDGAGPMQTIGCWDRVKERISPNAPNKVMVALHDGSLVGAYYELMHSTDPKAPCFMPYATGPRGYGRFHLLYEDPDHALWIQRNDMLYRLHNERLDTLVGLREYTNAHITGMAALSDGTLVMGTMGHGLLFLRDGNVVRSLREADGLLSDRCDRIQMTGDTIAVATSNGAQLVVLDRSKLPGFSFDIFDPGTTGIATSDALELRGELYTATTKGVYITHGSLHRRPPRTPRLYISRITSQEFSFAPGRYFQLDHDHSSLVVDVAAVSLAPTSALEFQYRMDGAEKWIASSTNSLTLVAQEPGEHALQVRARVTGSPWSGAVTATFAVLPPFWSRRWFRWPVAVALVVLCYFSLRRLAHRRFEHRLAQLRQREALAEERRRIAMDLHDDLGADLSGTTMLAEAALHGQQDPHRALEDTIARVRGMMPKVDEIIWALDSKNDHLSSLIEHLERSSTAKAEAMGVRIEFVGPWGLEDRTVISEFRRVVLMLVKESVNNALKHSGCDALELCINVENDRLNIVVQDNGCGITLTPASGLRHGLSNMQARAQQFNGSVTFSDVKPRGTCVTIDLPLPDAEVVAQNRAN